MKTVFVIAIALLGVAAASQKSVLGEVEQDLARLQADLAVDSKDPTDLCMKVKVIKAEKLHKGDDKADVRVSCIYGTTNKAMSAFIRGQWMTTKPCKDCGETFDSKKWNKANSLDWDIESQLTCPHVQQSGSKRGIYCNIWDADTIVDDLLGAFHIADKAVGDKGKDTLDVYRAGGRLLATTDSPTHYTGKQKEMAGKITVKYEIAKGKCSKPSDKSATMTHSASGGMLTMPTMKDTMYLSCTPKK